MALGPRVTGLGVQGWGHGAALGPGITRLGVQVCGDGAALGPGITGLGSSEARGEASPAQQSAVGGRGGVTDGGSLSL